MQSQPGFYLIYFLLFIVIFSSFSCSMSFEKRRYRPGYHVNVIQNHRQTKSAQQTTDRINNQKSTSSDLKIVSTVTDQPSDLKMNMEVESSKTIDFIPTRTKNIQGSQSFHKKHDLAKWKVDHALQTKGFSIKKRRIGAWILWGIALLLVLLSIISAITNIAFAPYYYYAWTALWLLPIIAILSGIAGLLVRVVGEKKEPDYEFQPKLVEAAFIVSVSFLSISILALVFSFFSTFIILCFYLIMASFGGGGVAMGLGIYMFKDDKSVKTKLAIAFGVICLILAILAFLLIALF